MALLTTQEAAEQLGVSRRRVQQFIEEKRLPAEKRGRDWFIEEEALKLLANRKPGPRPASEQPPSPAKKAKQK